MARPIDQKEYLKRYLSAETEDSSKKKRRKKVKTSVKVTRAFNIVDDDLDLRALAPAPEKELELHNPLMADETPLVADVIDERPEEEILLEQYRTSKKWKTMAADGAGKAPRPFPDEAAGKRTQRRHDSSDSEDGDQRPGRRGGAADADLTPAGGRRRDPSPAQRRRDSRRRHDSSSDSGLLSPERGPSGNRNGRSEPDPRTGDGGRPGTRRRSPPPGKSRGRRDSSSESDEGPPRRPRNQPGSESEEASPGRPDSDVSPRRHRQTRGRHDSDSDADPTPLKRRKAVEVGGRKPGHDSSDSDLSPQRKSGGARGGRRDHARSGRHDSSDSDLSLQRKSGGARGGRRDHARSGRHNSSDSDLSPPRRGPSGKNTTGGREAAPGSDADSPDSDLSPRRRRQRPGSGDEDLSPIRRGDRSPRQREREEKAGGKHRPAKTLAGTTAGLSNAKAMRRENAESRRRDDQMYSAMDAEVSGRNAKTVFRDKRSGRTRDLEVEKQQRREDEVQKEKDNEQFVEWGKGVAQSAQKRAQVQEALQEVSKPLARYRDDQDLDQMLRQQEIEGDPMLQFLRAKRAKKEAAQGVKAKPKYRGRPPPPNRFNLMPGYRWDGVDRSNGFEKKMFIRQADRKATTEIAYKWSIEDM